jgi:hypothetical protein
MSSREGRFVVLIPVSIARRFPNPSGVPRSLPRPCGPGREFELIEQEDE